MSVAIRSMSVVAMNNFLIVSSIGLRSLEPVGVQGSSVFTLSKDITDYKL